MGRDEEVAGVAEAVDTAGITGAAKATGVFGVAGTTGATGTAGAAEAVAATGVVETAEIMEAAGAMETPEITEDSRKYELVLRHIENGILDGAYHAGDYLPPERDLATSLNVGRSAVREAIRVLQTQGLIESSIGRGGGTRVVSAQGNALARILRLHLSVAGNSMTDLIETRVALERVSAAAAARNASRATVANLADVVTAMREAPVVEVFNPLDTLFHVLVARAGQNNLVADLTVAIRDAVRHPILESSQRMGDWPSFKLQLCQEHAAILDAITDGDPPLAADLMEQHIRTAFTALIATGPTANPAT